MTTKTRYWLAGAGLLALGLSLQLASRSAAGDDKAVRSGLLKIAAAIEKGDDAGAKSMAKGLKFEDFEDVMNVFKPRTKKGLGIGPKPGLVTPDGIELKLIEMGRDAPSQNAVNKGAEAMEKMAYVVAAVAEVAAANPPKDAKGKKLKDWTRWAADMREAAPVLAKAAKSKSPAELQKAAAKLNASCNSCHSVFK